MSVPDCSDVCEIVHMRLNALGFKISADDEDHTDIIEALSHVKFVRDDWYDNILIAGICMEMKNSKRREYYTKNKDKVANYQKKYYEKNKEKIPMLDVKR